MSSALLEALAAAKAKHTSRAIVNTFKLKEGKNRIRILPAKDGGVIFWQDLGTHWIKNADGKVEAVAGCHDIVYDTPCPVCAALDKAAKAASSDEDLKAIKDMGKKKAVLVNAIVRGADNPDPQIVELPSTVFTSIASIIAEYAEEHDVLDLKTGIDFVIERTGKNKETKYSVVPALKSQEVPADAMKKAHDLADFVRNEFFAKETKALNSIAGFSGAAIAAPTSPRAALTGATRIIDAEAEMVTSPSPKTATITHAAPAAAAAVTTAAGAGDDPNAVIGDADLEDIINSLDGI